MLNLVDKTKYRLNNVCFQNDNVSVVEWEFHMFFCYKRFDSIRNSYLFSWYSSDRKLPNFYALMSSTNEETIYKNALYVKKTTETLISIYQLTLISLFELIYILVYTCIVFVQVWLFDQNVDIPYIHDLSENYFIFNLSLLKEISW